MVDWEEFVTNVKDDGRTRAYMFEWTVPPLPETLIANANLKLVSTSIPGSEIEEISAYWLGVQYKVGGTRRFNDWNVTVMCDNTTAKNLRLRFEIWMSGIAAVASTGIPEVPEAISYINDPRIYSRTQVVTMLDDNGNKTQGITIAGSWPKSIGEITLDRGSTDFAQFDVTFAYYSSTFI